MLSTMQNESDELLSKLKNDSMSIRVAKSDSLNDFTKTQALIHDFFKRFNAETEKIHQGMIEKMPSPYSSAQGTYVESVFDKVFLPDNTAH